MAHVEDLGFSMADLYAQVTEGNVRRQVHPEFPDLYIHNYSEEVQFRNKWNHITLACRGLILNQQTGEVVARPWEKFFNLGQMDNRIESDAPVEVTDKMDGSLGILYRRPDNVWAIATRGSFASEQAIHATKVFQEKYAHLMYQCDSDPEWEEHLDSFTLLAEIIYPDNRIVVNYGQMDDLVVLGAVDKSLGHYYGPSAAANMALLVGPDAPPRTEVWKYEKFTDAISAPDRAGKEGYCIRSGSKIVKLKQADYVELHRIVTNLSPKTVWEMLGNGKSVDDICSGLPDEFYKYVEDIAHDLRQQSSAIKFNATVLFDKINYDMKMIGREPTRRNFAEIASRHGDLAKYLFLLLDGRDIDVPIWNAIKPRGDIKSLIKDEDSDE